MEILVKRAIDRSKYPKAMIYVDRQGNICKANRSQPLSPEEKSSRQVVRDVIRKSKQAKGKALRDAVSKAKEQVRKEPSVANAGALESASHEYAEFKAGV